MTSWWVPVGVLLGTAGVVGGLVLLRRRRGWPRRRSPAVAVLVVGLLAAMLTGLNSYAGYVTTPSAIPHVLGFTHPPRVHGDRDLPAGHGSTVVSVRLGSPRLSVPTQTMDVYLPPGYRSDSRRYPVLYLYGGWPGRSNDWLIAGRLPAVLDELITRGRVRPMIVVLPDTTLGGLHDTECLDAVSGPRLGSFLAGTGANDTVPGYLDRHFRTIADRHGRAFAGMSSGGFCALNLGLHHTGEIGSIAALEPYPTAGAGPESAELKGRPDLVRRNRILDYLPTMRFAAPVPVFLDWPRRASARERRDNERLVAALRARGQHVTTRTEDSAHTWHLAQLAAPAMLEFVSAHLAPPGTVTPRGAPR
ncbi:esterase [Actinocatenispora sera]|uniref:Esterase n=2 Tax=Actinocatenispora sera TaxID=390989 RepID=A0A810KXG0_9ACTN|nr:esterase [Actinocatenispora sera]